MNRRGFLISGAALGGAVALAACAGKTTDQLTQDVNLLVAGATSVVASLRAIPKVPADVLNQAQMALDDIKANAANIGASFTVNPDVVQAISTAVTTLAALVTPFFPLAAPANAVVQAILALVPVILAAVGKPAPAAAAKSSMSPADARMILMGVKARAEVRLGGFAPVLAQTHDAGKVRLGGFAPSL